MIYDVDDGTAPAVGKVIGRSGGDESLKVQTRSETDGIEYFDTLKSALAYTRKNRNVWKISFNLPTGERVRLVRDIVADTRVWVYEALLQE